jgi:hypothetical protein
MKYASTADFEEMFPEMIMLEDFLQGFVRGAAGLGNMFECNKALDDIIYYGFDMLKNSQIYIPSKAIKQAISME